MRIWLLGVCVLLIFAGCTGTEVADAPTPRGPIVPTRVIPTNTPTLTPTNTSTPTMTFTPSETPTFAPTLTPSETATFTTTPSETPTSTLAPTLTPTPSATVLATETPFPEATPGEAALYRNSTALDPVVVNGAVTLGNNTSGSIDDQHPASLYTFDATAGMVLDIAMTSSIDGFDAFLLVLDPKGREIARDDDIDSDHRDAAIHGLTIPEAGTYIIVATRYGQEFGTSNGDFTLTVTAGTAGETPSGEFSQLTGYDAVSTGTLDTNTIEQIYTFRAAAGDVITIQMSKVTGDLDPHLALTDNLGNIIAFNEDNLLTATLDSAIQGYIIPKSGYYTIIATRFTGQDNAGDYRMKLARDSQGASGVIALLDPFNSRTINDEGSSFIDFGVGDTVNSNQQERTLQVLITFRLPPIADAHITSATFEMEPCYERGGGFATLGDLTIYEDNYGVLSQGRNVTRPLPGARILGTQNSCTPIDLTSTVAEIYANGGSQLQLRLVFRDHQDNGTDDEVLITPRLLIQPGS